VIEKSPTLESTKNVLIDMDGVICEDIANEQHEQMIYAEELPGVKEAIDKWRVAGHTVTIFTARTDDLKHVTIAWLKKHNIQYDEIIFNKPRGGNYVYIDDKKIQSFGETTKLEEIDI